MRLAITTLVATALLHTASGKVHSGNYTGKCWSLNVKMNIEVQGDQFAGSGTNGIPGGAYAILGEIDKAEHAKTGLIMLWAGRAVGAVPAQTAALLNEGDKGELEGTSYTMRSPCTLQGVPGAPNTFTGSCWSLPALTTMKISLPEGGGWLNANVTTPSHGDCRGYFTPAANQLYIYCQNLATAIYPADLIYNPKTRTFSGYSYYNAGANPTCRISM